MIIRMAIYPRFETGLFTDTRFGSTVRKPSVIFLTPRLISFLPFRPSIRTTRKSFLETLLRRLLDSRTRENCNHFHERSSWPGVDRSDSQGTPVNCRIKSSRIALECHRVELYIMFDDFPITPATRLLRLPFKRLFAYEVSCK